MKQLKEWIQSMYQKKNFAKRLIIVLVAVTLMGFALSWLVLVDMGTDPYTGFNLAVAARLHTSLGNWQAVLNLLLFLVVIVFGRNNIGFGTVANMLLVGYACDFFSWIWSLALPQDMFAPLWVRVVVLVPALVLFIFAAALYMDVELGTSPYDAISFILAERIKKIPFRVVRMIYDTVVMLLGFALGARVGIVTIVMAFTLGPVITLVGKKLKPFLEME